MKIETIMGHGNRVELQLNGTTHYEIFEDTPDYWIVQECGYSGRPKMEGYKNGDSAVVAAIRYLADDLLENFGVEI